MQQGRGTAIERAGEAMGVLAAPMFALTTALRRARTFHPRGDCADADVTVAHGVPPQHRALAQRLSGNAFVRFSDALTKKKARWPDVLGCAVRFGGDSDDPAVDGDQDLLFATIRRPWTMPLSPFTTKVQDYLANDYFAVSPFSVPGERPSRDGGRPFERAIANGSAAFTLGIANGPWGPFAPLVTIQLVSVRLTDPATLRFDPFRSGRGIEPHGFVHSLRRGVYGASQRARIGLG